MRASEIQSRKMLRGGVFVTRIVLDLTEHEKTDDAYRLSASGRLKNSEWIPKSLCEKLAEGKFRIEVWKANDVGFWPSVNFKQGRLL